MTQRTYRLQVLVDTETRNWINQEQGDKSDSTFVFDILQKEMKKQ